MRILTIILFLACANTFGVTPGEFAKTKEKAEKGDAVAQYNLGLCYANGIGVPKDKVEAGVWYRKSAEQGCALGQLNYGLIKAFGQGVTRDPIEGHAWLIVSSANNTEAKEIKDKFEGTLTAKEIQSAQSKAGEIQAGIESRKKADSK